MVENISKIPRYLVDGKIEETLNLNNILVERDSVFIKKESIYDVFQFGYILGNETLFEKIKREPVINVNKLLEYYVKQKNNNVEKKPQHIFRLLVKEVESYIESYRNVGILLSGGLDSRILAGVLKHVQTYKDFSVTVLTWGMTNSRDVIYAQKISALYEWDIEIFYQDKKTLLDSLTDNSNIGCETNPVNLHSMKKISNANLDLILAGSFGDAIGRAEYSGSKAEYMPSISERSKDKLGFFKNSFIKQRENAIKARDNNFYSYYTDKSINNNILKEISMLENHHIKYLQVAMSIIDEKVPLKQVFTSYELIGFVFSLDYDYRYNKLYQELLPLLPMGIGNLPWARTGKPFLNNDINYVTDEFTPRHHEYATWLSEISEDVTNFIDLDLLEKIGIFNMHNIKTAIEIVKTRKHEKLDRIDRNILWLASFSIFINNHKNIEISNSKLRFDARDFANIGLFKLKQKYIDHKNNKK